MELEEATNVQIADELFKRSPEGVVVTMFLNQKVNQSTLVMHRGMTVTCIGLLREAEQTLLSRRVQINNESSPI